MFCLAKNKMWVVIIGLGVLFLSWVVKAQGEETHLKYSELSGLADRIDHVAQIDPAYNDGSLYYVIGDRFCTVQVLKVNQSGTTMIWESEKVNGVPQEVIVADLDGDLQDDTIICRTAEAQIYAWSIENYTLVWQTFFDQFSSISCLTTANMDSDQATEIVILDNGQIFYIDGVSFSEEFKSFNTYYKGSQMRCGNVVGDRQKEVILNSGVVLDGSYCSVTWDGMEASDRIELLDIDGDGLLEVLTENVEQGSMTIYEVDFRREVLIR